MRPFLNFFCIIFTISKSCCKSKVDEMREAFLEFDIDGDGTITAKVEYSDIAIVATIITIVVATIIIIISVITIVTIIIFKSMKITGAWNGDDATWTFTNRGGVEEDGRGS